MLKIIWFGGEKIILTPRDCIYFFTLHLFSTQQVCIQDVSLPHFPPMSVLCISVVETKVTDILECQLGCSDMLSDLTKHPEGVLEMD